MPKLPEGTYLDTDDKEYRQWPAISYSNLADFFISQDHALMHKTAKSYFEEGTAFELLVEDRAKDTHKFEERFFIANALGAMPDDLAGWIEKKENLTEKYRLKKDGERNNQSKRLHSWLDECLKNPGKMPMGVEQMQMLNKMVDNFMKMQPLIDVGVQDTLENILPLADFQVPIIWYVGKQRRKALIDILFQTNSAIYAFDTKTAADMKRFSWMCKDRYWIQEVHYSSGLMRVFKGKDFIWRFLVSSKAEPWISQPFCIDRANQDNVWERYSELCTEYQEWVDNKRPAKGWKALEAVKIYF